MEIFILFHELEWPFLLNFIAFKSDLQYSYQYIGRTVKIWSIIIIC